MPLTPEGRRKLSLAAKKRWRLHRLRANPEPAAIPQAPSEGPTLPEIFDAAAALVDQNTLKYAIVECCMPRTLIVALTDCGVEGTSLQNRLRATLKGLIQEALKDQ